MREAHISWNAQSTVTSEYAAIAKIADKLEVVAHLDVTDKGVRQLIIPTFKDHQPKLLIKKSRYLKMPRSPKLVTRLRDNHLFFSLLSFAE